MEAGVEKNWDTNLLLKPDTAQMVVWVWLG